MGAHCERNVGGKTISLELAANPSHLEAVTPLVYGRAHALQKRYSESEVLPVVLHGDLAVCQGILSETMLLEEWPAFSPHGCARLCVSVCR